jgi:hypothetical protein
MSLLTRLLIKIRFWFSFAYWKKHFIRILETFLACIGSIWLFIEIINFAFGNTIIGTENLFWTIIIVSALFGLISNLQKTTFRYTIRDKDINIRTIIGDMFSQKGDKIISTNTTFDTTFEDGFISRKSLQGKLFDLYYTKIEHLDNDIQNALKSVKPVETLDRTKSKCEKYEVGTTIKLTHKDFRSYWVALASVNENGKPYCTFMDFQVALEGLWGKILTVGHMEPLIMPILGSGRSALNENRMKILKEIINSFVSISNEKKITEELIICIFPRDYFDKNIDIDDLDKFLEYTCKYRYEKPSAQSSSIGI